MPDRILVAVSPAAVATVSATAAAAAAFFTRTGFVDGEGAAIVLLAVEAVYATGLAHSIDQCRDLLANGVDGLHFYTLNKSRATVDIVRALGTKHAF